MLSAPPSPRPIDRRPAPIGFHVTIRLADDRPIAMTAPGLRVIARVVLMQGERRGLLAFGAADDHLHAELASDRATAGAFAQYVEVALGRRLGLGAPFERARIRPLQDQKHAYNTFRYVHRQDSRHDLHRDPFREGTSLPDLLGLRMLETSLATRVRMRLPRVHDEELIAQFPPGVFEEDRPIDLDILAASAAAVFAIPDLRGRCLEASRARRAAIHVAGPDAPTKHLGDSLGIRPRAVQALRALPPEANVVCAVRMQALLRTPRA